MEVDQDIVAFADAFAALGSGQRLVVMRTLVRAGPNGLKVGELRARLSLPGSTLTHHLRCLADAGLVTQERKGREIRCVAAAFDRVASLTAFLMRECCIDASCSRRDDRAETR